MPKANELKSGMVVDVNGEAYIVKQTEAKSPSSRGAATLYKVQFSHLKTKQKMDESFKGDDFVKEADCIRAQLQFSFVEGDMYNFMDSEDFSQHVLNKEDIEGQLGYLSDGLDGITGLILDGILVGIEVPQSVSLEIMDTAPGIKGASATGRTKPATLSTGLEVQVPEYLEPGEIIKINTANGKFISRA